MKRIGNNKVSGMIVICLVISTVTIGRVIPTKVYGLMIEFNSVR